MPYKINRTVGGFEVVNRRTGLVHAKHTTEAKAKAQVRLLNAVEHGMKPRGKKS